MPVCDRRYWKRVCGDVEEVIQSLGGCDEKVRIVIGFDSVWRQNIGSKMMKWKARKSKSVGTEERWKVVGQFLMHPREFKFKEANRRTKKCGESDIFSRKPLAICKVEKMLHDFDSACNRSSRENHSAIQVT